MSQIKKNLKDGYRQALRPGNEEGQWRVAVELEGENALVWLRFGPLTIPAGQTVIIDTNLLTSFSRIDYILNFKDNPTTVTRSLKVVAQNNAGNVTDTISERMGGAINLSINITDDAIDAFLEITNNEAFDVDVTYLRAIIP